MADLQFMWSAIYRVFCCCIEMLSIFAGMKRLSFVALCAFLLSVTAEAQVRKYSNEFLSIGVDARALGMSNAVVASVQDVTAGYWNPAGLVHLRERWEIGLMHAEYFAGIANYDYLAGATPIDDQSTFGASLIRFGVDDILDTSELIDQDGNIDYDRINLFSAADYALLLSYARNTNIEGLSVGGNVKLIYRGIGDFADAFGFGFDLGTQYHTNAWSFAATLRDATTTFNAWRFNTDKLEEVFIATGNEIPTDALELTAPRLTLAAGRAFVLGDNFSLYSEIDLVTTFDGRRPTLISSDFASIDPSLGLEFGYRDFLFLRMGVGNVQEAIDFDDTSYLTFQPNLGIGFRYQNISLDYALTDIGDQSVAVYSNVFSLKLNFARKQS